MLRHSSYSPVYRLFMAVGGRGHSGRCMVTAAVLRRVNLAASGLHASGSFLFLSQAVAPPSSGVGPVFWCGRVQSWSNPLKTISIWDFPRWIFEFCSKIFRKKKKKTLHAFPSHVLSVQVTTKHLGTTHTHTHLHRVGRSSRRKPDSVFDPAAV